MGHPARQPVSTWLWSGVPHGGGMQRRVVGLPIRPSLPENTDPSPGEDADGMGMVAASRPRLVIDGRRPGGGVGEAGDGSSEVPVAGAWEDDAAALARLARD